MVPIRLIADGVNEQSVRYEFTEGKAYSVGEAEKIKKFLGYVFFGNESVYKGSIEFEFTEDGDTYVIKRDFEKTAVTLKKNARETLSGGEAEAVIADIVKVSEAQWEDTGGRCLDVFANMEDGLDDVTGASETLNKVTMSDFDTALEGTKRRVGALFAEFLSPTAQQAANLLNGFNAILDGKGAEGCWQAVAIDSGEQDKNVAERQRLMDEYGLDESEAFLAQIRGGDVDAALKYREQVSLTDKIKSVVSGWFGGEDTAEVVSAGAQSLATSAAARTDEELGNAMPDAGVYAVTYMTEGMEQTLPLAEDAGTQLAQTETDAVLEGEMDAYGAGDTLGNATVDGTEDGAEGMYDAGANAAQGAIDGARSGEDAMYSAGAALGGAFRRGFQNEMQIHSPSRAAMEDMAYVTEGYLEQAERDQARIAGGAAALADALREGFGRPELAMPEIASGGGGLSAGALAQAIREELDGMAVMLDGERVGTLTEIYSSRATSERVAGTVSGQSSLSKSW